MSLFIHESEVLLEKGLKIPGDKKHKINIEDNIKRHGQRIKIIRGTEDVDNIAIPSKDVIHTKTKQVPGDIMKDKDVPLDSRNYALGFSMYAREELLAYGEIQRDGKHKDIDKLFEEICRKKDEFDEMVFDGKKLDGAKAIKLGEESVKNRNREVNNENSSIELI